MHNVYEVTELLKLNQKQGLRENEIEKIEVLLNIELKYQILIKNIILQD